MARMLGQTSEASATPAVAIERTHGTGIARWQTSRLLFWVVGLGLRQLYLVKTLVPVNSRGDPQARKCARPE
jgi:hypothetical protein